MTLISIFNKIKSFFSKKLFNIVFVIGDNNNINTK